MPEDPGEGEPERVGVEAVGLDLDREDRALVVGDGELGERELVVPAQQPAVRLAEHVADRRRVMRPADHAEGGIQDHGHAEVEAAASVEDEIPGSDPVAVGSFGGGQAQVREPAFDIGRAHARGARIGG